MKLFANSLTLILLVALFVGTSGCKKDSKPKAEDTPDTYYYVRFKIDGVAKEYKNSATAMLLKDTKNVLYNINGSACLEDLTNIDALTFMIWHPPSQGPATYTNTTADNLTSTWINVQIFPSKTEMEALAGIPYQCLGGKGYKNDFKLTLTEVTSEYVKGTFSGTVYYPPGKSRDYSPSWPTKYISEGKFYLKIRT